jgi:Asp-tRNA(Asn)/Glu-tRNA(Gln) amidotransferase A subunit family amidase
VTSDGLPVGIQIIANHFDEGKIFQAGHAFEKSLNMKLKTKI